MSDVVPVRTVETRDTVLAVCQERGDDWANAVQARILQVHDLQLQCQFSYNEADTSNL